MKRVLVTGGTGALGSALTHELGAQGVEVVAVFRSNVERALQVQRETDCQLVQADCCDEAEVESLFTSCAFDAVVHLAGRNRDALALSTSPSLWNEILKSHLDSAFLMCRASLRNLPCDGQLLLVSSRVGLQGNIGQSAYASAKAGVFGLMKAAALEGRARRIRVNALCPGVTSVVLESLSKQQQKRRREEDLTAEADARESFAGFVSYFLASNCKTSGQILRPDCRI